MQKEEVKKLSLYDEIPIDQLTDVQVNEARIAIAQQGYLYDEDKTIQIPVKLYANLLQCVDALSSKETETKMMITPKTDDKGNQIGVNYVPVSFTSKAGGFAQEVLTAATRLDIHHYREGVMTFSEQVYNAANGIDKDELQGETAMD